MRVLHRVLPWLVAVVVLVVATAVSWARLDPVARATLWAEDGRDFVSDASTEGLGATLFRPFGGYLQLLPRLLAWVATRVTGPEHLAQVVTLLACATVGVVSALLWAYGRTLLGSDAAALLLAAVPPLIPTAPREALGTLNNLHSWLLLLAPVLFAAVPRRRWSAWAAAAIALVVLLSEPQAVVFVPLLLLGIRSPRRWPLVGAVLLGAVAAVVTAVVAPRPVIDYGGDATVTLWDAVLGFVGVPVVTVWTSDLDGAGTVARAAGVAPFVVLAVVCLAVVVVAALRATGPQRALLAALVVGAGVVWSAALLVTPAARFAFSDGFAEHVAAFGPIRYTTPTSGLLAMALVVAAAALWTRRSAAGGEDARHRTRIVLRRSAAGVLAVAVLVPLVLGFHPDVASGRDAGPTVPSQLEQARTACALPGATSVDLRQSPDRSPWTTTLSCADVER